MSLKNRTAVFSHKFERRSYYSYGPHILAVVNKTELNKKLKQRKRTEIFYVSKTYSCVTPESAEFGDFSETGYEDYGQFWSLKDLIRLIERDFGFYAEFYFNGPCEITVYGDFHTTDYRTGEDTQEAFHISAEPHQIKRLQKIIKNKQEERKCRNQPNLILL